MPHDRPSCWTCRARRKKCDGSTPSCKACTQLQLTCYAQVERPDWMDGGIKQESMIASLKQQVKSNAIQRHARTSNLRIGIPLESSGTWTPYDQKNTTTHAQASAAIPYAQKKPTITPTQASVAISSDQKNTPTHAQTSADCMLAGIAGLENGLPDKTDSSLMVFYLEHVFPFMFPFYKPSLQHGGKGWLLEMMLKSPAIRQAILCQSSYYLSLSNETSTEDVLAQTRHIFHILRQTTSLIHGQDVAHHIHGVLRTLTSIIQLQRFEIALSSFSNCQAHLNACVSLFRRLLDTLGSFEAVNRQLGSSEAAISSAQDAFRFSTALLIVDDIMASTVQRTRPQLYDLQHSLLTNIDLDTTIGCQNWVILQLSEIASLNAWKEECKTTGTLDIIELVQHALPIRTSIESNLSQLYNSSSKVASLVTVMSTTSTDHLVTRIWAHAALLYLFVTVSGWQMANKDIRINVQSTLDLLRQVQPTRHLRAVTWPLCVAGCLAQSGERAQFRSLVHQLEPPGIFAVVYRALEIMERTWQYSAPTDHDIAACMQCDGQLVLLV